MGLQKASIREASGGAGGLASGGLGGLLSGGSQVDFQFNPETLSFTKSATFKESETKSSKGAPIRQFIGTKPIKLSLKLVLDDTVSQGFGPTSFGASVTERVNQLLEWTDPGDDSDNPQPKDLVFEWGKLKIGAEGQFPCHCESVKVEYSLFTDAGEPIRATATVELIGLPTKEYGQNPTSGGLHARRTRRLQYGDDLAAIAHQEYGRQSAWRELAAINEIDNPFRLPVGRELLLPDRSELGTAKR